MWAIRGHDRKRKHYEHHCISTGLGNLIAALTELVEVVEEGTR